MSLKKWPGSQAGFKVFLLGNSKRGEPVILYCVSVVNLFDRARKLNSETKALGLDQAGFRAERRLQLDLRVDFGWLGLDRDSHLRAESR